MSRERKAAILVIFVAIVAALLIILAAGQLGYEYPGGTIPPF